MNDVILRNFEEQQQAVMNRGNYGPHIFDALQET
jgi:hypothetical protein